jgi:hypothetical protein
MNSDKNQSSYPRSSAFIAASLFTSAITDHGNPQSAIRNPQSGYFFA